MIELKIDPKFRDLIPKLTDDEYAQLEKNILAEGKIREPIVVWNGTIIDGHHRYYIAQKHPDIPVEIEEKEFANDHEALAWACSNQLGRRNLTQNNYDYLTGRRFSEEKLSRGGTGANRYTILQKSQDGTSVEKSKGDTASKIAKDQGIGRQSVFRDEQYYKGVEEADKISPGIKEDILHGTISVPKKVVRKLPEADQEVKEAVVKAIEESRPEDAMEIINRGSVEEPTIEIEPYNAEDMAGEIDAASRTMMDTLEQILFKSHLDIVRDSDGNAMARISLVEHLTGINGIIERLKREMED